MSSSEVPTKAPEPVKVSVSVGLTSIIGWLTAIGGAIPIVVKLLEEGQKGLALSGPERWGAILGVIALAITQLGRYVQSAVVTHQAAKAAYATPRPELGQLQPIPIATLQVVPAAAPQNGARQGQPAPAAPQNGARQGQPAPAGP